MAGAEADFKRNINCVEDSSGFESCKATALEHKGACDLTVSKGSPLDSEASGEIYRYLMRRDGDKVGEIIITISKDLKLLTLDELFIEPKFRGQGAGIEALSVVDSVASKVGVGRIVTDPCPTEGEELDEGRLREWYTKAGYVPSKGRIRPASRFLVKLL